MLVAFEEPLRVPEYVGKLVSKPMPRRIVGDRITYASHGDFGETGSPQVRLEIIDFDAAHSGNKPDPMRYLVQPPVYRAPEVLMGIPWSYSLDIRYVGALVSELRPTVVR